MAKYTLLDNWRSTCDGRDCECYARCPADCSCYDVDWTSTREYELMAEINSLRAMLESEGYNISEGKENLNENG